MKSKLILAANLALVAVTLSFNASADNLVVNGGFETGDFTG